jgi:cobalamin biosynthesis protein CobW
MTALLDRPEPPEHILIETSGLALPKPLIKAFNWPGIRSRVTVDGVVTVVDGPAVADGRFADDPAAVEAQRAADDNLDHDNPLAEVYEDQLGAADLVVLNKADLLDEAALTKLRAEIAAHLPRQVKVVAAREGALDIAVLLGLGAAAEDDLAARPSHHDGADDHEHDDFDSFVVPMPEMASAEALVEKLSRIAGEFDILRMKGFSSLPGKPMRLAVQGVGTRFRHHFDRPWAPGEARQGQLVVIGQAGLDKAAIAAAIAG